MKRSLYGILNIHILQAMYCTCWMQKSTRYDVCGGITSLGSALGGQVIKNFGWMRIFFQQHKWRFAAAWNLQRWYNVFEWIVWLFLANHCSDLIGTHTTLLPFGRQSIYFNRTIGNRWVGGRVTMQLGRGCLSPMTPPNIDIATE